MRRMFQGLVGDDTPMVRRAAAKALGVSGVDSGLDWTGLFSAVCCVLESLTAHVSSSPVTRPFALPSFVAEASWHAARRAPPVRFP
jgi:hypothetical protein